MVKDGETRAAPANMPWGMIVGIMLMTVLLVVGSVFGILHFSGVLAGKNAGVAADQEQVFAEYEQAPRQAIYVSMEPPFLVNFEGRGPARFLQISVEVMTREPEYEELIKKHTPVIRNNLVMLFSSQTYKDVETLAGKEKLRETALREVQKILEEETGYGGVEALYFTSFVMQ